MRKRFLSAVFALSVVGGIALPAMAESRLFPAMGISQTDADERYVFKTGDTVTGSLAVDGDVTIGNAAGDAATVNAGTWTFVNPLTVNIDAATTFDATGQIVNMTATSWDYRGSSFAPFIINATTGPEAVNRDTGDVRWGQLAAVNAFTAANTFDDDVTLGDAVDDAVSIKAGTVTHPNATTFNLDAATTFDGTGNIMTMNALTWAFGGSGSVTVPNPASSLGALNSQTGDARYVAQASVKSGTVAGGSFAGNPKTFTVTFGTAFPDTNYAVTVDGEDARTFTFQTKLAGSFVINTNANLAIAGDVDWTATAHNDP